MKVLGYHALKNLSISQWKARCRSEGIRSKNSWLRPFFFGIGSSESIGVLQDLIQAHRRATTLEPVKSQLVLSRSDRLKEIERLSGATSYYSFLRRCHILSLFIEYSAENRKSSDGFIVDTVQTIAKKSVKKKGNPWNRSDAHVSKSIMAEVYPLLEEGSDEYDRKYRSVSTLRRLGGRLHQFVSKFGYGILVLLPATCSSAELTFCLSDPMILDLKNAPFKELIRILDEFQGHILHPYCRAVENVTKEVFQGTLLSSNSIAIGNIEREQILKHPKGSPALLQLLSKASQ